ncbi:hypothetical protein AB9F42_34335, partial [Rhizobium leguminosarum]
MIILSLDTAGVDCAAAVYDSGRDTVLGEASDMIGKGHAEHLIESVAVGIRKDRHRAVNLVTRLLQKAHAD